MDNKTIYALSTVYGKSGVAVIRISGQEVLQVVKKMTTLDYNKIKPLVQPTSTPLFCQIEL